MSSSTQTSTFVKKLAANDRPTRDAALQALKNYLNVSKTLPLLEYEKLWKGLFYSMWFCDRPRPQQRLAESLGELFSLTIPKQIFSIFLEAFYVIIIKEWPTIDQWRIDKFYMLIRRVVRHSFKRLQLENWDSKLVKSYLQVLERVPLSGEKNVSVAIPYHLSDIYIDELEHVVFEDIKEEEEEEEEDKEDKLSADEKLEEKSEIIKDVPVEDLISPFLRLSKDALLKTLREKVKLEVLDDQRLKDWNVIEDKNAKDGEDNAEVGEEDSGDESDWNGFA